MSEPIKRLVAQLESEAAKSRSALAAVNRLAGQLQGRVAALQARVSSLEADMAELGHRAADRIAEELQPQPSPVRGPTSQPVLPSLLEFHEPGARVETLLKQRSQQGMRKYGGVLCTDNGRDPRIDALQEALDGLMYEWQHWMETTSASSRERARLWLQLARSLADEVHGEADHE